MTKGKVDYAVRQALNEFDRWNDVIGFVDIFLSKDKT